MALHTLVRELPLKQLARLSGRKSHLSGNLFMVPRLTMPLLRGLLNAKQTNLLNLVKLGRVDTPARMLLGHLTALPAHALTAQVAATLTARVCRPVRK